MTSMIRMVMMRTSTLVAMHKSRQRQDMPDVRAEMVSHDPGTSLRGAAEERKYSSTRDLQTSSTRYSQTTSKGDTGRPAMSTSAGIQILEIHVQHAQKLRVQVSKYRRFTISSTRVSEVWCFHFQKIHNLVRWKTSEEEVQNTNRSSTIERENSFYQLSTFITTKNVIGHWSKESIFNVKREIGDVNNS